MYTFHVYKVLTTTLTPTVGFEPTDLSAHQFSKLLAYNHLHTLAYSLVKPLLTLCYLLGMPPLSHFRESSRITDYHFLTAFGLISLEKFFTGLAKWVSILFSGKMTLAGIEPCI